MDDSTLALSVLKKLPLADSVLRAWRFVADEATLSGLYDRHRGRGYERTLSFPVLVHLIVDALAMSGASGREAFDGARTNGVLPVSIQAAYGKLRRLPPEVSEAFLFETTRRLQQLWPASIATNKLSACFDQFDVMILDGKTVKNLHRRLKPLRGAATRPLGGKALVALDLRSGLVTAMQTDCDGDANEVRLTPALMQLVRTPSSRPRLWVGDRAFSYLQQTLLLGEGDDEFVVRRRRDISFERDTSERVRNGVDEEGRKIEESWGWLSRHREPRALYVRRIKMNVSKDETLDLITSLQDGKAVPATEVLSLYRRRWRIERVFQEVTQVFGLKHLIGGTPRASLFQFAICLLLYNTLQWVRASIAVDGTRTPSEISSERLFRDMRRQLSAWSLLGGESITAALAKLDADHTGDSIGDVLVGQWNPRWARSPTQGKRPRRPHSTTKRGRHVSAQKLIESARHEHVPAG